MLTELGVGYFEDPRSGETKRPGRSPERTEVGRSRTARSYDHSRGSSSYDTRSLTKMKAEWEAIMISSRISIPGE